VRNNIDHPICHLFLQSSGSEETDSDDEKFVKPLRSCNSVIIDDKTIAACELYRDRCVCILVSVKLTFKKFRIVCFESNLKSLSAVKSSKASFTIALGLGGSVIQAGAFKIVWIILNI
jgi:hypothetical protein